MCLLGFPLIPHSCQPLPWARAQGKGYDNNDMFHWLETTRSCVISFFSCNFFNSNSWLVSIQIGVKSTCVPSLGVNSIGNNGCNLYIS